MLHQGYAYILSHPGTPCIFYDHLWQDGSRKTSMWGSLRRLLSSASSGSRQARHRSCTGNPASSKSVRPSMTTVFHSHSLHAQLAGDRLIGPVRCRWFCVALSLFGLCLRWNHEQLLQSNSTRR